MLKRKINSLITKLEPNRDFTHLFINEKVKIPVKVSYEPRNNMRIAMGKNNIYLRLPLLTSKMALSKHLSWADQWIHHQITKDPRLIQKYSTREYKTGDVIKVNGVVFEISILKKPRKSIKGSIEGNRLSIQVPSKTDSWSNKDIQTIISRTIARYFLPEITHRIRKINSLYFKEPITSIKIKYNKSNWGSCSAKRNINISSRLLLAPKAIQDYVFVHELAHLKEMNHSPRFWKLVGEIVPDYREKEKWLKSNSYILDF